jgi:Holliday junction resolvase RusA-like endonuclease
MPNSIENKLQKSSQEKSGNLSINICAVINFETKKKNSQISIIKRDTDLRTEATNKGYFSKHYGAI